MVNIKQLQVIIFYKLIFVDKFYLGEQRLSTGGSRGTETYKDIREYFCEFSSTRVIYIHLPTTIGLSAIENINYIEKLTNCTCIHAVILSSYHGDLNL